MENTIIVTTPQQIESIVFNALEKFEAAKKKDTSTLKLLSVNQVAKALSLGHTTVKNLITKGLLKATENNKIRQSELDRYLENK
jgi:hypothetical protein